MQTDTILQVFSPYIQRKVAQLSEELGKTLDFRQFEKSVMELMKQLEASLIPCFCTNSAGFNFFLQIQAVLTQEKRVE